VVGFIFLSGLLRGRGTDIASFLHKSLSSYNRQEIKYVILQQYESEEYSSYSLIANMLKHKE
jgi:hypothetical protein